MRINAFGIYHTIHTKSTFDFEKEHQNFKSKENAS